MDDAIRHAITKLSHLHFAAAEPYRQRILQLGEDPARVFNVGAPWIDHIVTMARLGRADLERDLNFRFARRNLLVTLHPETVGQVSPGDSATRLLAVLDRFPDLALVITTSNADTGGRDINRVMEA